MNRLFQLQTMHISATVMRTRVLLCCALAVIVVDANTAPEFQFQLEMKTPQLIGIIAGFVVFCITVMSVIYLLVQSGSWSKFVEEMQSGKPLEIGKAGSSNRQAGKLLKDYAKLYDNLLEASRTLPLVIENVEIESTRIIVRNIDLSDSATSTASTGASSSSTDRHDTDTSLTKDSSNNKPSKSSKLLNRDKTIEGKFNDIVELYAACNGSAIYHESAYDPLRLWMWHESGRVVPNPKAVVPQTLEDVPLVSDDTIEFPIKSHEEYADFLRSRCGSSGSSVLNEGSAVALNEAAPVSVLCIVDKEFGRPVGTIDLVCNSPKNLTIQLDNMWLTPAFQGRKFGCEAMLLVLSHLFNTLQYRRVTYEVDDRHTIGKKFLVKCGFKLEATLHKHRIVQERNRDSCVYVVLNSDWPEVELDLRRFCNIPPKQQTKMHNIAEIDSIEEIAASIDAQGLILRVGKGENVGEEEEGEKQEKIKEVMETQVVTAAVGTKLQKKMDKVVSSITKKKKK